MRDLTIDEKWGDWKFGDTDAIMTFTALDDGNTPDFSNKTLTFKIADVAQSTPKQPKDYVASAPGEVSVNHVLLNTSDVSNLGPSTYLIELWAMDKTTQKTSIYPSKGFATFTVEENTMRVSDVANVPDTTLNAIWGELMKKIGALKQGEKGDPGKTPKLKIGTVTKLANDQQPAVSLIPSADDPNTYTINFQLPAGPQGKQGDLGLPGTPGGPGLNGSDGLTPKIDPKTKHWIIGNADTGVVAEGQPGKDADPSKYVSADQFTTLRQTVSDNSTDLADLKKQITDLQAAVKELQGTDKPTTPDSGQPKSDQPAKSDTPVSGSGSATNSGASASDTPASAQPAASDTGTTTK